MGIKIRIFISLLAWVLCVPGIFLHAIFVISSLDIVFKVLLDPGSMPVVEIGYVALVFLSGFSWFILAEMNAAWVKGRCLPWPWPVAGLLISTAWILPLRENSLVPLLVVAPGVVLAIFLVFWHLWHGRRGTGATHTRAALTPVFPKK